MTDSDALVSVPAPGRHSDVCLAMAAMGLPPEAMNRSGFVTSQGRFVDRGEAFAVAGLAGQIAPGRDVGSDPGLLTSEDVW